MALGAACDFAESASFGEFPAADCEAARSGDSCGPSAGQYSSFVSPSVLLLELLRVLTSSQHPNDPCDTSRVGTAMSSAGESGWGGPGLRLKMASVAARMLESMGRGSTSTCVHGALGGQYRVCMYANAANTPALKSE